MKNILMILTGGTIACEETENGLSPRKGREFFEKEIKTAAEGLNVEIKELMGIDSSDMDGISWNMIARYVYDNCDMYDGMVICHVTDTMAYTAAALSFMLLNINIPVVLTGAQRPLAREDSDGRRNLEIAFKAASSNMKGVFVAFYDKVIEGIHCVKTDTTKDDAFESINAECAAVLKNGELIVKNDYAEGESIKFKVFEEKKILDVKLIPDMAEDILDFALFAQCDGVIIECFGLGGMGFLYSKLPEKIKRLIEEDIPVILCSQCLYGESDFSVYEGGLNVLKTGALQGRKMTKEAVYAKLRFALSTGKGVEHVRKVFETNYLGELD